VERPWQLPGFFFCRLFTHIGEISFPYGRDKGETSPNYPTVNWPKAQENAYPNKRSPMKQFNKEKRKEKTDRGRKKEKKKKAIFQGRRRGSQGFWNKNTTQGVEIFISKPEGLDLDGHLRGGCGSLPYLWFSFYFL
jgi:hypothetical protein